MPAIRAAKSVSTSKTLTVRPAHFLANYGRIAVRNELRKARKEGAGGGQSAPVTSATLPRHDRALEWRKSLPVSRAQLSEAIGYPIRSIQEFEAGERSGTAKGPISEAHWLRYAMACAAFQKKLDPPF